ncbi:hypothetical protein [Saccharopolyspora sp. NPDC050642]|uniref:hypothetical protein n=1 Tax=Saccharopolyspora sp. NPDC050642 TaxID=3157099 RepID=UPI003402DE4A
MLSMEVVWAVAFWIVLIIGLTWWLLFLIAAGYVISVVVTTARDPRDAWRRPELWGRLGAGCALAFLATVGYGITSMKGSLRKDPTDPCTIDDDLMGNHPIMDWPLSDTSCSGYESVPTFVNPAICLFAVVSLASMAAVITTRRRARARLK